MWFGLIFCIGTNFHIWKQFFDFVEILCQIHAAVNAVQDFSAIVIEPERNHSDNFNAQVYNEVLPVLDFSCKVPCSWFEGIKVNYALANGISNFIKFLDVQESSLLLSGREDLLCEDSVADWF